MQLKLSFSYDQNSLFLSALKRHLKTAKCRAFKKTMNATWERIQKVKDQCQREKKETIQVRWVFLQCVAPQETQSCVRYEHKALCREQHFKELTLQGLQFHTQNSPLSGVYSSIQHNYTISCFIRGDKAWQASCYRNFSRQVLNGKQVKREEWDHFIVPTLLLL